MKQFNLKFTEENLNRHFNYNKDMIFTIRDEPKGDEGDVTLIKNIIYDLIYMECITMLSIEEYAWGELWKLEGFNSNEEYITEIRRIYGEDSNKELYLHVLKRIPFVVDNQFRKLLK